MKNLDAKRKTRKVSFKCDCPDCKPTQSGATVSVSEHTPTPWKLDKDGKTMFIDQPPLMGLPTRLVIGTAYDGNATFIVRAVNSFDEMLALLKQVVAEGWEDDKGTVKALIAKATGGK